MTDKKFHYKVSHGLCIMGLSLTICRMLKPVKAMHQTVSFMMPFELYFFSMDKRAEVLFMLTASRR
jgi:hypothetical protein